MDEFPRTARSRAVVSITLAALLYSGASASKVLAGVDIPQTRTIGGQKLVLASCGVRHTLWIEHYVAGLYLRPGQSITATSDAAEPKAILLHVIREASLPEAIPEQWREPLRKELERDPLARVRAAYTELGIGDRVLVAYRPGAGVSMSVNGRTVTTVRGHSLIDSMLHTWAEGDPLSGKLRRLALNHPC